MATVSVVEMLSVKNISTRELEAIIVFLETFSIIPFTLERAKLAGRLRRQYHLSTPDAEVAATALSLGTPLLTNDHGFRKITELELIVP